MKRFLFQYGVKNASGSQTFYVDAESLDEARKLLDRDGGDLYSNEVEVTDLTEPEYEGETTLDDFGDYEPPGQAPQQPPAAQAAQEPAAMVAVRQYAWDFAQHVLHNTDATRAAADKSLAVVKAALRAQPQADEKVVVPDWRFDLNEDASEVLRDTIGQDDPSRVTLSLCDGHSGRGLYVWVTDYPEEGSLLLAASPTTQADPGAEGGWLRQGCKACGSNVTGAHSPDCATRDESNE
jgi:hypothetical protein